MKNRKILMLGLMASACFLTACGMIQGGGSSSSSETESGSSHTHYCKEVAAVEATCTSEGLLAHYKCASCDELFKDKKGKEPVSLEQVTIAKLPHETEYIASKNGDCKNPGNIEYWTCTVCEKYFTDEACETEVTEKELEIDVTHDMTYHAAKAFNGRENGWIEHWTCGYCEGYFADAEGATKITQEDTVVLAPMNIPDFLVEVETGRDPIVLQLSDTQIIDAGQTRPGRDGVHYTDWATNKMDVRCYDYLREIIPTVNPDLIILTGDIVYGEFDDNGSALLKFVEFMESFQIPWAPVFGNHDNESKMGVDWQCAQFENAEYCLFEQKTLTGNGNYSVGIAQDNEVKRVFYMLDSNGCGNVSAESLANGHTTSTVGFGADQIKWYTEEITALKAVSPDTKISFAYHIQQNIFVKAFEKYGFDQAEKYQDINIDTFEGKAEGDFGYIGRQMKGPWDTNYSVWNGMKALGVDSVFVGHEHCNSASVVYEGVRFQFGQKSSEYDRYNCLMADGSIKGDMVKVGTPLIGGTVIPLSEEDGSIGDAYIYYCGDVFGTNK